MVLERLLRVPWTARRSNQSIVKAIKPENIMTPSLKDATKAVLRRKCITIQSYLKKQKKISKKKKKHTHKKPNNLNLKQ